jgi:hypothetical protein
MVFIFTIIGIVLIILGIVGCIVPGIPGPPLSYLALISLSISKKWEAFSLSFLISMAGLTIFITALDYVIPALGAKKFGASKYGFWGAIIGMLVGLFYAPPIGMIIGAFIGAFLGEIISGKQTSKALKTGWGVFAGIITGTILKLIVSGIMTFYFFKALF